MMMNFSFLVKWRLIICLAFLTICDLRGNEVIENISNYDSIVLAKSIKFNESNEIVIVDILKGSMNDKSFTYLQSLSGFSDDSERHMLFLYYISHNDNGLVKNGAVKICEDLTILSRGLKFHILDLYRHLKLTRSNHTFPKFIDAHIE